MIDQFNKFCENRETYAQIRQDLLALFCFGEEPKYFVEFGACDGVYLSNTFMLEKYYNWTGLLVEPSYHYIDVLKQVRTAQIDTSCVSDVTGNAVDFVEISNLQGLSGLEKYAYDDQHSDLRKQFKNKYSVNTISLNDLLDKYNCPPTIDYLSIDTEGSEFIILDSYDFSRKFNLITVEHNNTYQETLINNLIVDHGYIQIMSEESKWDSWFVSKKVYDNLINNIITEKGE
jgi:FkbM family methyltransferase